MGKTIQFVATASKKVINFDKTSVTVKRGALVIERIPNECLLRVTHFGTVILELDYDQSITNPSEYVSRWHIQSITDANYIQTIMDNLGYSQSFRTGFRPVNGGGYFEAKIGDEWVPMEGEE